MIIEVMCKSYLCVYIMRLLGRCELYYQKHVRITLSSLNKFGFRSVEDEEFTFPWISCFVFEHVWRRLNKVKFCNETSKISQTCYLSY